LVFAVNGAADIEQRLAAVESRIVQQTLELAEALEANQKLQRERDEYKNLVKHLREENERLKRGLLGQKAERLPKNDSQLSLAILGLMLDKDAASKAPEPPVVEQVVAEHTRKKPARNPFPDELPRVTIELLPPEVEREGLDAFEYVGQDTREVLERRPASNVIVRLVYKKYVRKERQNRESTDVLRCATVELPIERGLAGPNLLAETIVRRWQDHMPLNRLSGIYAREGIELAKSTICTWHEVLAEPAAVLVDAMFQDAYGAPYLCTDATGVLVQAPERCRNGHFWVLVAPEKHVLFRYSKRHDSAAVDELLCGYRGYLVADAHSVYEHLFRDGNVIEVGCWAHSRRYVFKALPTDPERSKVALSHMAALFAIERTIADSPRKKKEEVRQQKSRPIVDKFFQWVEDQWPLVLDDTPIYDALRYARNQRDALRRFLDDGRLPMHNNMSELNLRRQACGRKNWLFVGSDDAAKVNTTFVSLLASCQLHGIEPLGYLRDLFILLPGWPRHRVLDLAPAYWRETLEQPETQQKLLTNVFRRVVLGSPV
jgi:transposase